MAPRRGGSGFYYDNSAWSSTTILSLEYGSYGYGSNHNRYKDLYYAMFAFDILTLIAFIVFLVWSCTIRGNRGLPIKTLNSALFSFILSQICTVVVEALYVASAEVMMYYLISYMLSNFFHYLGICLTFYVFWSLQHRLLSRLTDSGKPYAAVTTVHWILLALTLLFSLVVWALYVVYVAGNVTYRYFIDVAVWVKVGSALYIVFWLLSLEVLAWSIFVAVKAGTHRFVSKMPVFALINAAVGWFALTLTSMVIWVRYNLEIRFVVPDYLSTVQAAVSFIFWVVTFVGLLLCCSKWRRLGQEPEKYDAPAQYPYPQYPAGPYPPPPGQAPPGQYQTPYPNQPHGTAPYYDYAANPAPTHPVSSPH
ncbi:unnamed protein product [Penicillium salamii]|uniref:Uncharacterized protein n=1 Tax=Penicillium salamii TaxID=1612424 RepID=A0A9W4IQA0_9EURO|nr:unnamed protein product [Penicillium salamii]CAG8066494.1 unnamed protein product [Penicillium salamii]CAG8261582.1 unnamed protein product [Penicillium salamii]CAG8314787.1 unnamed protein product [Penicillium salamii]CAG8322414.1 unnamed protein product [Penicillium salamii]